MQVKYITSGPVRGSCDHLHRTIKGAFTCLLQDRRNCSYSGGYSDRWLRRFDGLPFTERELNQIDLFESNRRYLKG